MNSDNDTFLPDESTLAFAREHATDNVDSLLLHAGTYPGIDMRGAVRQIEGRRKAAGKLPEWSRNEAVVFPPGISLEQCSSEFTARYKARLALRLVSRPARMADLSGGFGVDSYYIGRNFDHVDYVEKSEELCAVARHNFATLGCRRIEVFNEGAEDHLKRMAAADLIFIDPSRRNRHGGRTYAIGDCEPDVGKLKDSLLAKAEWVIVKLSPMFDWHEAVRELEDVAEIHIVSTANECKELLVVLARKPGLRPTITCVDGESELKCDADDVRPRLFGGVLREGMYLYEPNASIQKAGCYGALSEQYDICMLASNSHLFVSEKPIDGNIGRSFRIEAVSSMNKKQLRASLGGIDRASISVRNFPLSAQQLRQRLRLKDGGESYLFGTTLQDGSHVIIKCKKMD